MIIDRLQKASLLAALTRFRSELRDLNVPDKDRIKYLEEFKQWFERSGDYDLAEARVFEHVIPSLSKKNSDNFKNFWYDYNNYGQFSKSEVETKAKELMEEEKKKPGFNWEKALMRVAKVIAVSFGLTLLGAISIARKVVK